MTPSAYLLRLQTELAALTLSENIKLVIVDLAFFNVEIIARSGPYRAQTVVFEIKIPELYPHHPPTVRCQSFLFHPNIDSKGRVCLAMLGHGWKPVFSLSSLLVSLENVLEEPSSRESPLVPEVAQLMEDDYPSFLNKARTFNKPRC